MSSHLTFQLPTETDLHSYTPETSTPGSTHEHDLYPLTFENAAISACPLKDPRLVKVQHECQGFIALPIVTDITQPKFGSLLDHKRNVNKSLSLEGQSVPEDEEVEMRMEKKSLSLNLDQSSILMKRFAKMRK